MMTKYIACICEGGAETAIMNMLLDQNKLIFSRDELLEGEILKTRKGKDFETRYLKKDFAGKIKVYRVLDSRRENFKSVSFVKEYFSDISVLEKSLYEYKRISKVRKDEKTIYDLLILRKKWTKWTIIYRNLTLTKN